MGSVSHGEAPTTTQARGVEDNDMSTSALMDDEDFAPLLTAVRPFTMVCEESLLELARQVVAVQTLGIQGDFVECGVWRGGASFLMASLLRHAGIRDRRVWLFDSYAGLPAPEEIDGGRAGAWARNTQGPTYFDNCSARLQEVQLAARELGLDGYTEFVEGWFEHTLPAVRGRIGQVSLLRIDCDWHASVLCCLENLYDQVSDGGLVILDDYYSWDGCAIAVHEFLGRRHVPYRIESVFGKSGAPVCAAIRKGGTGWNATWSWIYNRDRAIREIHSHILATDPFILVDEGTLEWTRSVERAAIAFPEREGRYVGPPADDAHAIAELQRLRTSGVKFIAFAWPSDMGMNRLTAVRAGRPPGRTR